MKMLVLGASEELLAFLDGEAELLPTEERYPLIAVMPSTEMPEGRLRCDLLQLWDENAGEVLRKVEAESVVSCGFAPHCTLTLSSMEPERSVLTVQRAWLRADGTELSQQEIPLPQAWSRLSAEERIMLAGIRLLTGTL